MIKRPKRPEAERRPFAVAVVGGRHRSEPHLTREAIRIGIELTRHDGWTGGRGARELRAAIGRCDAVVVVTRINSHGSMYLAKQVARELRRPIFVVKSCTRRTLHDVLSAVGGAKRAAMM